MDLTSSYDASIDKERAILLIGANRGLGLEVAKNLSLQGYQLIASARSWQALDEVSSEHNLNIIKRLSLDFSSKDIQGTYKRLSSLPPFNGVVLFSSMYSDNLLKCDPSILQDWGNFYGHTLSTAKACMEQLKAQEGGRIILIGSIVGSPGRLKASQYSLFKGWLRLLAEVISNEGHAFNVSGTYLNLGSFRDTEEALKNPSRLLMMSYVVKEVIRLLSLPFLMRVECSDLFPVSEMTP